MSEQGRDIKRYLDDLALIKKTLVETEEHAMLENWAFYTWALIILLGTFLSQWLAHAANLGGKQLLLIVWLPLLFIGTGFEALAWIRLFKKESLPLLTRKMVRFILTIWGLSCVIMFQIYFLLDTTAPLAGLLLMVASAPLFALGFYSFFQLFAEAFLLLLLGLLFILLNPHQDFAFISTGIIISLIYFLVGLHSRILEKKNG